MAAAYPAQDHRRQEINVVEITSFVELDYLP
jgi:hypothetical protein